MMMRRTLVASVALAVFTAVLAVHAQDTTKGKTDDPQITKGKNGEPRISEAELAKKEKELHDKFGAFEKSLLTLYQRLSNSSNKKDQEKAAQLKAVLDTTGKLNPSQKFSQFIKFLGSVELKTTVDIAEAVRQASTLAKDLKEILDLLKANEPGANKKEERIALEQLVKELETVIRNQKLVRSQIGNADNKSVGDNQKDVRKETADLENKFGGKGTDGGEAKNMKGTGKEGGAGEKGKGKDLGKDAGDGTKSGDAKNPEAGGQAKPKDGKGGDGEGAKGQSKDAKGGDAGQGKGKDGKGGDGEAGKDKKGGGDPKGGDASGKGKDAGDKGGQAKAGDKQGGGDPKGGAKGGDKGGEASKAGGSKSGEGSKAGGDSKSGSPSDAKQGEAKGGADSKSQGGSKSSGGGGGGESAGGGKSDNQPPPPGKQQDPKDHIANAKQRIQDAQEYQKKAEEELKKNNTPEAADNANNAANELEKAKKRLEDLIRQLRDEEMERVLAALIQRCQRMLEMQQEVLRGTVRVDAQIGATPGKKADRDAILASLNLSDDEAKIVLEATKAIDMLESEGSAVAFPEAFQQVREDMKHVQRRLKNTDVGEVTQAIEQDIIDTLKEMIKALEKAKQELDDKKNPPMPPKEGQPPPNKDEPLIKLIAELKMLKSLQLKVNSRTELYSKRYQGEQAMTEDIRAELQELARRQERIFDAAKKLAAGDNK
jgi:hypothetical protein